MKVRTYLRVGKKEPGRRGPKALVKAGTMPSEEPLQDSMGRLVPTVAFAVDLDIPDEMFERAEQVIAELVVDAESATIAAKVKK